MGITETLAERLGKIDADDSGDKGVHTADTPGGKPQVTACTDGVTIRYPIDRLGRSQRVTSYAYCAYQCQAAT